MTTRFLFLEISADARAQDLVKSIRIMSPSHRFLPNPQLEAGEHKFDDGSGETSVLLHEISFKILCSELQIWVQITRFRNAPRLFRKRLRTDLTIFRRRRQYSRFLTRTEKIAKKRENTNHRSSNKGERGCGSQAGGKEV